jgi:hypothetical protein
MIGPVTTRSVLVAPMFDSCAKRFASFRQANVLTNIQILCLDCHKDKTAASR